MQQRPGGDVVTVKAVNVDDSGPRPIAIDAGSSAQNRPSTVIEEPKLATPSIQGSDATAPSERPNVDTSRHSSRYTPDIPRTEWQKA